MPQRSKKPKKRKKNWLKCSFGEIYFFDHLNWITYLYAVYLSVTAIRARAKSKGYVQDCDVIPAREPAKNRRAFVLQT